jgi:hypothetical protein
VKGWETLITQAAKSSEVLDQRMEGASPDNCYPSRFPEYLRFSPQLVVDTDDSDATVDETYCAICLRAFEDDEDCEEWWVYCDRPGYCTSNWHHFECVGLQDFPIDMYLSMLSLR